MSTTPYTGTGTGSDPERPEAARRDFVESLLQPAAEAGEAERREALRRSFVESVLDNLSAWTVVAAAIALLYLVWATLEILDRYLGGGLPKIPV